MVIARLTTAALPSSPLALTPIHASPQSSVSEPAKGKASKSSKHLFGSKKHLVSSKDLVGKEGSPGGSPKKERKRSVVGAMLGVGDPGTAREQGGAERKKSLVGAMLGGGAQSTKRLPTEGAPDPSSVVQ